MTDPKKPNTDQETKLELYKAYLEDLGRIGSRHETLRQFYETVISALFVFLALAGKDGLFQEVRYEVQVVVGLVGINVCLAWFLHMWSFAGLFKAKQATLRSIETDLPVHPFGQEKTELDRMWRPRLTAVDRFVALVFIALFIGLLYLRGPSSVAP